MIGVRRQTQIYLEGVSGRRPQVPLDARRLEAAAQKRMRPEAFAYVAAGAGNEHTVAANRAAFERWRIMPRTLRDVEHRDTSIELFGQRLPSPFLLAPVGVLELAHPEADCAVAGAARDTGTGMVFSNQASRPMEGVARILGDTPHWFQLYWSRSDELVESLAARAERSGCRAIVITLDTTMLGWRSRDLEGAYLPFLHGKGIAQYTSDPVFKRLITETPSVDGEQPQPRPNLAALRTLIALTRAYPDSFWRTLVSGRGRAAVQHFTQIYSRPSLTWAGLGDYLLNLAADFDLTMGLAGCRAISEIGRDAVVPAPASDRPPARPPVTATADL